MSHTRVSRIYKIVLGQSLVILAIVIISLILVFYSQGFRINYKSFKVYKTGVIDISSNPHFDQLIINGEEQQLTSTQKVWTSYYKAVTPGQYDLKVKKDGYYDWSRTVRVESDNVYDFRDVILFKKSPKVSKLTNQSSIDFLNSPTDVLAQTAENNLTSNQYEIWINGNLVTRFSEPISGVKWFPDTSHIIYQQGNEIRVIEKSGFNDTLLAKLNSNAPTRFAVGGQSKELYLLDGNEYFLAQIR